VIEEWQAATVGECPCETLQERQAVTAGAFSKYKINRKEAAVAVACLAAKGIFAFKEILTYA
jgi:hypothetical protein